LCAATLALCSTVHANMYDVTFPNMVAPAVCKDGCALWSDLASDGNNRKQADVDKKWSTGKAPDDAGRNCAMPANDPDSTYWCYCKNGNLFTSYGYCTSPTTPVVEQLNLQYGAGSLVVAGFVTFGEAEDAAAPQAQFSTSESGPWESATGITNVYDAPYDKTYNFHFVKMTGLKPGETYYYKVKSGGSEWSEVHSFTQVKEEGPTRAAIFGDMGVYKYNNMQNMADDVAAGRIEGIIHMGDHAYNMAEKDGTRGDGYMNAFSKLLANLPWVPTLGNHEFYGDLNAAERYANMTYDHDDPDTCTHAHNVRSPVNALIARGSALSMGSHGGGKLGTPSMSSRYYSVDFGLVHLVSLDLNVYYMGSEKEWREPQLAWLKNDLEKAASNREAVPWIVVVSHYPMYCTSNSLASGKHQDGQGDILEDSWSQDCWSYGGAIQQVRDDLEPLYADYGVDLYLAGHEHNYESMWPVLNSTVAEEKTFIEPKAPVHFTTGAGGAPGLDTFGATADFIRTRLSAWGYGLMTAHNATHFTYDHILNEDGSLFDSITIVKSSHSPYKMITRSEAMEVSV
jgi:hypothetical protein